MITACQSDDILFAGIDVGSLTAKSVIINRSGIAAIEILNTGADPTKAGTSVFKKALDQTRYSREDIHYIVATGYGRVSLSFADKTVTEISCHAKGVRYLNPDIDALIDIGGQDSKVVKIHKDGSVSDFVMNDRCAAGTGKFLEIMARTLETDIGRFSRISADAKSPCAINSTCIVFAESEVISLLATGNKKEDIAAGLHQSIARRVGNMAKRLKLGKNTAFVGGVAKNRGVQKALEDFLGFQFVPIQMDSQFTGALGAAVLAREYCQIKFNDQDQYNGLTCYKKNQ